MLLLWNDTPEQEGEAQPLKWKVRFMVVGGILVHGRGWKTNLTNSVRGRWWWRKGKVVEKMIGDWKLAQKIYSCVLRLT